MDELKDYAIKNHVPIVRPKTLQLLIETLKNENPCKILEIGTAIGYSAINMLVNSNSTLVTIEKDEKMYDLAKNNFKKFGFSDRVKQILGDAKDVLNKLAIDKQKFDFVFLDGPKGQYVNYLPLLKQLLMEDGIIFADDVLFRGLVQGDDWPEHRKRTIVMNLRKYLNEVQNPPFSSQIIDLEDGVCITRKEKTND